jgi:predicted dinucleotide-binding enzyme
MTVAHVYTVAFQGIEAREVDVQVHIGDSGGGQFNVVGLTKPSTGEMVAEFLPGARIIRAFNTSSYANFAREAGRPAPRMGIPVAASDAATLAIGVRLVNEIGFDAVPVGGSLRGSAKFELRGPANGLHTAAQLKTIMGN